MKNNVLIGLVLIGSSAPCWAQLASEQSPPTLTKSAVTASGATLPSATVAISSPSNTAVKRTATEGVKQQPLSNLPSAQSLPAAASNTPNKTTQTQ
jgi:outer membrane receptor protein involved in Fe transport